MKFDFKETVKEHDSHVANFNYKTCLNTCSAKTFFDGLISFIDIILIL